MNSRRTGRTGLRVSEICLGTTIGRFQTEVPEPPVSPLANSRRARPRLFAAAYPHAMLS